MGTCKAHFVLGLGLAGCQKGMSVSFTTATSLITSKLPFDEWTETFGTERLTGTLFDRLTIADIKAVYMIPKGQFGPNCISPFQQFAKLTA